jgi:tetratricopeptide (TPR) repeat protein
MRVRSFIATVTCLAFTAMVAWPYHAHAQEAAPQAAAPANDDATMAQAKQHFEAGRSAYNAGDYLGSIREFKQAEALRPSPVLDYNIGLANEKLGKRRVAVKYYRRYLELQPNAPNKDEVQGRITSLEAAIAQQPPAPQGQPGGAPQAEEAPGDMPPPDVNAVQGQQPQQPGYDPYASAAPGQGPIVKKKHNYWWIWLIVAGGVALTIGLIVYVALAVDSATKTVNDGFTSLPVRTSANAPGNTINAAQGTSIERQQKPGFNGVTLFHF